VNVPPRIHAIPAAAAGAVGRSNMGCRCWPAAPPSGITRIGW